MKLLYSVFLPVISGSVCSGEEETSADNSALGETLDSQQPAVSKGGSKVTAERVALLVLSALLVAAAIAIYRVSMVNMQTKESLQMMTTKYEDVKRNLTVNDYMQIKESHEKLKAEHEALKKNLTEALSRETKTCLSCPPPPEIKPSDSCPKCEFWKQFDGKLYYFSNNTSSWEDSRRYCRSCGGDLVKIDSEEEQRYLTKEVSDKMIVPKDQFWIGLTDSKEEGKWFWVDGSPLNTRLSFWAKNQPDDWKQSSLEGEDCVRMGEKGRPTDLECWFDKSCNRPHKSICEKQALNLAE